jgi:hypothetical protein
LNAELPGGDAEAVSERSYQLMRYLVTGGAGFIGSNTVDKLVRRGHNVRQSDFDFPMLKRQPV